MADKLQDWISDAGAYELLNTYKVEQQVMYPFVSNAEDFYITLLNRLFFALHDDDIEETQTKNYLLQIVKGLMVYSDENTAKNFTGVNPYNNQLYVAAIYYLCDYNALSNLFMWKADRYEYRNESAQLLYCILSSSFKYVRAGNDACALIEAFMNSGDQENLDIIETELTLKVKNNYYLNLDDFFDTHIARAVLKKFRGNNLWKDLAQFGGADFWKDYIAYSVKHYIFSLLPSQEDAIAKGALSFKRSFSLKMPTSGGKTFLTELLVYQEIKDNPNAKILYLAPLRSLSRELKERYGRLSREFNFDFRAAYGGSTTTAEEETIENAQLLIATPETFTTLEGSIDDLISNYTLVICDEGQLLEDKTRGVSYELLLTRLKRNTNTRFLFISAIIPNIADINQWLGGSVGEVGDSNYRPCKIRFAIAFRQGDHATVQYANEAIKDWSVRVDDFLSEGQVKVLGTTQKSFSCALALKAMDAGPVMLYCSMKDWKRGCLAHVDEVMSLLQKGVFKKPISYIQDVEWLAKVSEYCAFQLGDDYRLTKCVKEGLAYHHGQMPQDLRELIETSISKKTIQLVVCTKTLSEGINMPIKTAVLANITNTTDGTYNKSLELRDLKNIVGRVGRAGKESYGLVVLPYKDNEEPLKQLVRVLRGNEVELAKGSLYYVVEQLLAKGLQTDDEINAFLESEGVAEAIDMFINLNKEDVELDNINLDDIIQESLAHYLGDDKVKNGVKKIFKIRYNYIKKTLPNDEYGKFLSSGLPVSDYNELKGFLADKTVVDFELWTALDGDWIHWMMQTIYSLGSVKREVARVSKSKPLFEVHQQQEMTEMILTEWLSGSQYVEMANKVGCTTEQAALYVDFIQKTIAVKAQSIVACINETFDINDKLIDSWPEMVKRGVNDERALILIDAGLGDRVLVNALVNYAINHFHHLVDKDALVKEITHNQNVDEFVMNMAIPVLIKDRWKQFLRSKV